MAKELTAPDIFSFDGLKKLDNEALLDRLEAVDNQATLIRWRILYELRCRFKSDTLFGQFIAELKNARTICDSSRGVIYREYKAGEFCERHNIQSLESAGVLKSTIYLLSKASNDDISEKIFKDIKRKNLPLIEVERLIAQAKSITIEKEPDELERMSYEEPRPAERYVIPVVDGIAIEPEPEPLDEELEQDETEDNLEQLGEDIEDAIEHEETVQPMALSKGVTMVDGVPKLIASTQKGNNTVYRRLLLEELSNMDMSSASDDTAITETLLLWKSYRRAFIRQIPIGQGCIKKLGDMLYNKQVG